MVQLTSVARTEFLAEEGCPSAVISTTDASFITCTEILILREGCHFRIQRDGVTQQNVFAQHITLVPIIKEQFVLPSSDILCDFPRVKIAIGGPLGHNTEPYKAIAWRGSI